MKPTYAELELELNQTKELLKKALEEISKLNDEITKLKASLFRSKRQHDSNRPKK